MNDAQLFQAYLQLPRPKILVPGFCDLYVALPDHRISGSDVELIEQSLLGSDDKPMSFAQMSWADFRSIAPLALEVLRELQPKDITKRLVAGAKASENYTQCMALGQCFDLTHLAGFTAANDKPAMILNPRPDRFFGVPFNQLKTCHWQAFYAANEVARKRLRL